MNRHSNTSWRRLSLEAIRAAAETQLVDRATSEEVAQEALLAFCQLDYDPQSTKGWFRVVVRRLIWRRLAKAKLERDASFQYYESVKPREVIAMEDRLALAEVRDHLPEKARHVIDLVLSGLDHREIAERLSCRVNQVGPRIARALVSARRHLNDLR